jgi:hypothetical protein
MNEPTVQAIICYISEKILDAFVFYFDIGLEAKSVKLLFEMLSFISWLYTWLIVVKQQWKNITKKGYNFSKKIPTSNFFYLGFEW